MAISLTKRHGWRAIPTQYRKASDILTSTLAAILFSSHSKRERDREAHLNYYASANNRETTFTHKVSYHRSLQNDRKHKVLLAGGPNMTKQIQNSG